MGATSRRDFVKRSASAAAVLSLGSLPVMAGPFPSGSDPHPVPADKKLKPAWIKSLFARGEPQWHQWPESKWVGMPVGGICCGQVYLGGDGRLWLWDIFNRIDNSGSSGPHYAQPMEPTAPFVHGFAIRIERAGAEPQSRILDQSGWERVRFRGEYPIGLVEYRDAASPVEVDLEAFSPFIPLDSTDSALPVTLLHYTVRNTGDTAVTVRLAGWLENAVLRHSGWPGAVTRRNQFQRTQHHAALFCDARCHPSAHEPQPDILFEDFEKETYEGWTVTGTAFGIAPVAETAIPAYQGKIGAHGKRLVNSHATAPGDSVQAKDGAVGRLLSGVFRIERSFIALLIGGGKHAGSTCVNLLVDGQAVATAVGANSNTLRPHRIDARPWKGREARLEIVDSATGGWGNIGVDHIVFTDRADSPVSLPEAPDAGTMALALLCDPKQGVCGCTALPPGELTAEAVFEGISASRNGGAEASERPWEERLTGALERTMELAPGASVGTLCLVSWHFPNLHGLPGGQRKRHYATRFADAAAVADYVAQEADRLSAQTRLWRDTWYDSTLPYWFLDRTLATAAHLATNTCYWFDNGRFYAFEGVGCCPGTCTHVWHYAQSIARLFPDLERRLREMVDYGVAFDRDTGSIGFRGELHNRPAIDGQAGVILRTLREHQMSADAGFLKRVWPQTKKSLQYLLGCDSNADGIIEGAQHNTLDAEWFGRSSWLCGMYLAALRAGEEMAREMDDAAFAAECRAVFERGRRVLDQELFDGEYYIHQPDPAHRMIGSYNGCHIDQVLGQGWAWQLGLGRVFDPAQTRSALRALWRYNFAPDVGTYRRIHERGRWYAVAGDAGLIMCTWPKGDAMRVLKGPDGYFNECMSGFEHQAAGHMISEGMLLEGMAVTRAIHDRYHPSLRNPWNEIECGDHYGRAMASYGTFLAACGFEYHGPRGHLGFTPRVGPERFRAAFTAAEGWGTFMLHIDSGATCAAIEVRHGRLRVQTLAFGTPDGTPVRAGGVAIVLDGKDLPASVRVDGNRAVVSLPSAVTLESGQLLEVTLT